MKGSQENLIGSQQSIISAFSSSNSSSNEIYLTPIEKKFLLCCERGDIATVRRLLEEYRGQPQELSIDCVDPLNRSGLVTALENENIDLVRVLLDKGIKVKDSLLHAIKEEYVEGVEVLLEWEEKIHTSGLSYSWESVDRSSSAFTPDITPLILASHKNNYEILKILLDRGATLPTPHDVRCGCDECILSSQADSLRHSQARINAYKALSAPSLIALSSRDPLLTAFELSWELRRLSFAEAEFREEYKAMRKVTEEFATALLDHARTSNELEIMLNYDPDGEIWEPGERQTLERLKLAIKYKQKHFVAHPNVQQLLASIWYDGLPGFRRKGMVKQMLEVVKLGCTFPVYSSIYMLAPDSRQGQFMKKPFVKFIFHSFSYAFFLLLLGLASQRAEFLVIEWFGTEWMQEVLLYWKKRERGALPGLVESALVIYIISWIFGEVNSLWSDGLMEYIADLWNIVDFITNCFYMLWICLRVAAFIIVKRDEWNGKDPYYPREQWNQFDPMLLSEGAFAAGMIFSFLKLVHIFSVNPHLGPLQISLGRMIIDIIKFFFIYTLVLFAFGCGMNQLLWYYAEIEKAQCYVLPDPDVPDFDNNERACTVWRRFTNLFETSQSLFWASFGLVDLLSFDLKGIKTFTRFWALLLFGSYSVINIIVLLNMLIAMMSNSYQIISERSDVEWKFARSKLWISYFEEGGTLPAPFNLMPNIKVVMKLFGCRKDHVRSGSVKNKHEKLSRERHEAVMRLLIRRYVVAEQCKRDDYGITEDDVMEIRQDISTLRFELVDILKINGMRTPNIENPDSNAVTKKGKVMERRLIKDFQIGLVEGVIADALKNEKSAKNVFSKIANAIGRKATGSKKKDWNAIVRRSIKRSDPIGSTEERNERVVRQSVRRHIIENKEAHKAIDPEKLVEYNPKLSEVTPAARVAYAKFKMNKIIKEFEEEDQTENPKKGTIKLKSAIKQTVVSFNEQPTVAKLENSIEKASESDDVPTDQATDDPISRSVDVSVSPTVDESVSPTVDESVSPAVDESVSPTMIESAPLEIEESNSTIPEKLISSINEESIDLIIQPMDTMLITTTMDVSTDHSTSLPISPSETECNETKKSSESTVIHEEKKEKSLEEEKKTSDPKPECVQRPIGPRKPGGKSKVNGEVLTGWI